jgi:hypothetical protein
MRIVLRLLNGALGTAMIIAGLALARLPWIDVVQAPGSDAFRLIQFHFILTGAFSIWALTTAKRDGVMGRLVLLLFGGNGWLGYLALASQDTGLLWPLAFFVVTAVNLAYLLATDAKEADAEDASAVAPKGDAAVDGLIPADFGVTLAGAQFRSALLSLGAIGLTIGAVIAMLFCGAIYMTLLKASIFDKSDVSFSRLIANLRHGAGEEVMIKATIIIAVTLVVYAFVFLGGAIVNAVLKNKHSKSGADLDRDLTREERLYAENSLTALAEYLDARTYGGVWRILHVVGVIGVIAAFIAVPAALYWMEAAVDPFLKVARAGGSEPLYYSGALYVGAAVGGFFAGALMFWSLYQLLGAFFPEFGEYLFARAGWNSMNNRPREPIELLWVLVRQIRSKALDIEKPFDPAAFLYGAFRERESIVYKSTILAVVSAGILTFADLKRYEIVDDSGVSYSKYFQFASRRVDFVDIDRVELRCALLGPDDNGNVNLGASYILAKDGEFRIDLLDGDERNSDGLARLEALDARLSSLGAPLARAERAGFLQGNRSSFVSTCAKEIEDRYSAEIAPRLIRLLRVERFADPPEPGRAALESGCENNGLTALQSGCEY